MKMIIADDSLLLRERIKELLKDFENVSIVGEAANGTEALQIISETNPDVAIIDIRMPEINGIEVLKKVRESGSSLKIIMLTNYPYKQYKERCMAEGADYFFDKNQDSGKLTAVISELATHVNTKYDGSDSCFYIR